MVQLCLRLMAICRISLNDNLQNLKFVNNGKDYSVSALSFSDDFKKKQMTIIFSIVLFVASLILLSGMINFLKFAIQMFYNRQREVALRKSMGSDARGLFMLLFSEVFFCFQRYSACLQCHFCCHLL